MKLLLKFDILSSQVLYDIDEPIKCQLFTCGVENEVWTFLCKTQSF